MQIILLWIVTCLYCIIFIAFNDTCLNFIMNRSLELITGLAQILLLLFLHIQSVSFNYLLHLIWVDLQLQCQKPANVYVVFYSTPCCLKDL